jgi:hypothetical protein
VEAHQQARVAQLEAEAAGQAVDPAWSSMATEQIVAAVEQALLGQGPEGGEDVSLMLVRCGPTLCRLELASQDPAALAQFTTEFTMILGWDANARMHHTTNPNGSFTTVVYLARDGYRLPEPHH